MGLFGFSITLLTPTTHPLFVPPHRHKEDEEPGGLGSLTPQNREASKRGVEGLRLIFGQGEAVLHSEFFPERPDICRHPFRDVRKSGRSIEKF